MADWKPGDVVAVRAQVGTRDPVHGDLIVVVTDAKASHYSIDVAGGNVWQVPPHERLASLQAERDRLAEEVALRDAVVEAARRYHEAEQRRRHDPTAFVTSKGFRSSILAALEDAYDDLRSALAALDAENPRGATP